MNKLSKINASLLFLVTFIAALSAPATISATAQPRFETAQRETGEPIMAIISIESQKVTFYDANGWIYRAPVSTGTHGRETPAGIFSVLEKNREHRSNMYDDAKMPHMQRITWNGIALHGGPLPGYAASHGCVRMPFDFAARVFNKTRIGMRVIISPHDAAPIEFFHPTLFSPSAEIVAAAPARADQLKREAADASKRFKQSKITAKSTARQVVLQKRLLRKLERRKKSADARLTRADKTLSAATTAKVRAYERLQTEVSEATEAATQLKAAKSALETKTTAATVAATNAQDAFRAHDEAKKIEKSTAREAELQKKNLSRLETLKEKADAELISADKALSIALETKALAEEHLQNATAETTELAAQIDSAESALKPKIIAADAAAAAAHEAAKKSDAAKKVEISATRVVELRKETLQKLYSLKKQVDTKLLGSDQALSATGNHKMQDEQRQRKAIAEAKELAIKINNVELDLKTRVTAAAAVATIANDATQKSDTAKKVEMSAAREVELHKESIQSLKSLKEKADAGLIEAHQELSVADEAKTQAEEQQRITAARTTELAAQIETAKSELRDKIVAADTAATATKNASQAKQEAKDAERSAAREVELLKTTIRKLEGAKKKADAELKRADKALLAADKAKERSEEQQRRAAAEAAKLATQLDTAKTDLEKMIAAAATAKEAVKEAKTKKAESAQAAYESKLALEPASVYISRATQKLYVRRNTHKPAIDGGGEEYDFSIEVPITIRDPDKPIGTHIFTAMEHDDLGLRWTAVTIHSAEDAKGALDRITIPQEVLDRIAPTALPRSSIIISDEPLSRETNYRTEFVTVLSNYPQGGFITRKPTPVPDAEESDEESGGESSFVRRTPSFLNF